MSTVLSEATGAALAPETTIAVLPTAGWAIVQPNPGGIQGIEPKLKTVERDPLSVFATPEKGDNVGLDAEVTIVHDWNKDIADTLGESMFRCAASHFGGTGVSLFRPTAVTATGYTVPAAGALANGVLVYARGFSTAANNGLKKLAGASISTEIKTPGLTAEAAPPANATVDVIGYEASVAADIQVDASGNLTSTVLNFTTLNIPIGSWVILPTATQALAMGSAAYAFALYSGRARVTAITATKLTLERQTWTVGGADTAAGKTVRLFFASRFYRNYTLDTLGSIPGYKKATLHGEIAEQGPGTANAATYVELQGMAVDTAELNAPLEDKIVLTTKFRGLNIQDPVLLASRPGGAGSVAGDSPAKAYCTAGYLAGRHGQRPQAHPPHRLHRHARRRDQLVEVDRQPRGQGEEGAGHLRRDRSHVRQVHVLGVDGGVLQRLQRHQGAARQPGFGLGCVRTERSVRVPARPAKRGPAERSAHVRRQRAGDDHVRYPGVQEHRRQHRWIAVRVWVSAVDSLTISYRHRRRYMHRPPT
jgi:hypothetical protein